MRPFILSLVALFILSCSSKGQEKYNRIELKDIKTYRVVDTHGSVIDTLPSWIKLIKKYSFSSIDTTKILFSDPSSVLKYARDVLDKTYGKSKMDSEEPFHLTLIDNKFWFVSGSLPEGYLGGVAMITFSKYDGEILFVLHGK